MCLYREAVRVFGKENVRVAIGKNRSKDIDFARIIYHLVPYGIEYDIADGITLSDYCRINDIIYIVRGIRNAVDAEYELKLDFINKEIYPKIQTMFFPTKDIFSNISSSSISELLNYNKFEIVKKYMDEDSMYRFHNRAPEFVVFFGRSCIGKTHYLKSIFGQTGADLVEVDRILWEVFEKCFGRDERLKISAESKKILYSGGKLDDLVTRYSTGEFWRLFFEYIPRHFAKSKFFIETLKMERDVFLLDFPALGVYWHTIEASLRGKLYLIKLENSEENRSQLIEKRNIRNVVKYLDSSYLEPTYTDLVKRIDE
jgi:phosphopantetheine adenylyltransferase